MPAQRSLFQGGGDWIIEVNHRLNGYKREARQRLTSEEGIIHRGKRCVEPEAVFGQMKNNMQYKRFIHFHIDKVTMDFAFFAMAFNIKKLCAKLQKKGREKIVNEIMKTKESYLDQLKSNRDYVWGYTGNLAA